ARPGSDTLLPVQGSGQPMSATALWPALDDPLSLNRRERPGSTLALRRPFRHSRAAHAPGASDEAGEHRARRRLAAADPRDTVRRQSAALRLRRENFPDQPAILRGPRASLLSRPRLDA